MPHLVLATTAAATPMGAQSYEEEVARRAPAALDGWRVDRLVARSVRSRLPGTHRLPMGRLATAGLRSRRVVGRLTYPRDAVVHRMDLVLPPAPELDVVTLHDVVAWRFPDESAPVAAAAEELRRAAAVICVSHFSAQEAVDLLGVEDPVVVHNGVDARFFDARPAPDEVLAGLGLTGRYVLHAGGASRRKNLEALAEAWPRVHAEHPDLTLALAGPPHERRTRLFATLEGTALLGRVDDAVLPGLLAGASAVVVPSTHEGFGLPALEAMAVGTPVVAADRAALPEVVGDAGILVEPDAAALVDGLVWAVSADPEVDRMRERGRRRAADFTWERSVAGHARVWERVARG